MTRGEALPQEVATEKRITPKDILIIVSRYYDISSDDIKGPSRKDRTAWARHVCMKLTHDFTNWTLSDIVKFYNRRCHGTVSHAIEKVNGDLEVNDIKKSQYQEIEEQCKRLTETEQSTYSLPDTPIHETRALL